MSLARQQRRSPLQVEPVKKASDWGLAWHRELGLVMYQAGLLTGAKCLVLERKPFELCRLAALGCSRRPAV